MTTDTVYWSQWIKQGRICYKEDVTEGLDHIVEAFIGMLHGKNIGKVSFILLGCTYGVLTYNDIC